MPLLQRVIFRYVMIDPSLESVTRFFEQAPLVEDVSLGMLEFRGVFLDPPQSFLCPNRGSYQT
jgi:hypothetical protein